MIGPAVLVTRPEPGAAETARRLSALGWRPVLAPALVLTPRPFRPPRAQAVVLTSRAAARALPGALPRSLPVLAVGEATAEEARRAGFTQLCTAEGTAESLPALAAARLHPRAGPLLLAVGEGYAQDLAVALRAQGFRVLRRIAYAARPATELPGEARAALLQGSIEAVLFHSPRSARCAMSLFRDAGLAANVTRATALAMSPRVAEAARAAAAPLTWRSVRVAARPDQDALLALLGPAGPG